MKRILIAEDETRLAAFIEKGLRKNGFVTAVATDGEQALQMAENEEFELMLLDLGLPIKDGWTVLQQLRSQGEDLPVIVVTATSEDNYRAIALSAGANDYVRKPFRFSDLLERVQSYFNQKSEVQI